MGQFTEYQPAIVPQFPKNYPAVWSEIAWKSLVNSSSSSRFYPIEQQPIDKNATAVRGVYEGKGGLYVVTIENPPTPDEGDNAPLHSSVVTVDFPGVWYLLCGSYNAQQPNFVVHATSFKLEISPLAEKDKVIQGHLAKTRPQYDISFTSELRMHTLPSYIPLIQEQMAKMMREESDIQYVSGIDYNNACTYAADIMKKQITLNGRESLGKVLSSILRAVSQGHSDAFALKSPLFTVGDILNTPVDEYYP